MILDIKSILQITHIKDSDLQWVSLWVREASTLSWQSQVDQGQNILFLHFSMPLFYCLKWGYCMLSPKNILSINNLEAQDNPTRKTYCYYKVSEVLLLEKNKKIRAYQEYLLISKCANNCNINDIKHLGPWS